jgi:hypothetical protein
MTLILVETTLSDLKISTHTFFIILFINPRTSFVGSSTRRQPS